jgi:hypothetical protein
MSYALKIASLTTNAGHLLGFASGGAGLWSYASNFSDIAA